MHDIAPLPALSDAPAAAARTAAVEAAATASRAVPFAHILDGFGGARADGEGLGERFEASVLTPLVAAILPPEDSMVWGGAAGKLWRGLFAEELAAVTARSGGFGLASMIDEAVAARAAPKQGGEG